MKYLKDLKGNYGSSDISNLVEFIKIAPIQLPEDNEYFFEKLDETIHIYGIKEGIKKYFFTNNWDNNYLKYISITKEGIEMSLEYQGIEKIILHDKACGKKMMSSPTKTLQQEAYRESIESRGTKESSESNKSTVSNESRKFRIGYGKATPKESRGGESR
jgi:hypothetical protein